MIEDALSAICVSVRGAYRVVRAGNVNHNSRQCRCQKWRNNGLIADPFCGLRRGEAFKNLRDSLIIQLSK